MHRQLLLFAVLVALAAGCGHASHDEPARPAPSPAPTLPQPEAALPRAPAQLAGRLGTTTRQLDSAIAKWLAAQPAADAKPPVDVTLLALDEQRIYRLMRSNPGLGQKVLATVPAGLQTSARDNFAAGRSLARLMPRTPPRHVRLRTGPAAAPGRLLAWYREAERRFGVSRWVLASVNFIESAFGRTRNASYAGAQGPMQFLPATWSAYGLGGDVRDPHDAILGAANFLHASGAPGNYRRALWSYNNSDLYVDAVLRYARQMRRQSRRFYAYWSWQVFERTAHGEKRLTGPGRTG
jgi:membrane-bound lytic murein transglycosylase B